ncbi:hypothetical protein HRG_003348 [Hirsutella rhossiliensis]|uniref:Uncharacterized protein n=1 Tax=Hirsutella rhossiliensis TaxID=111463 RepID=A0A9P8N2C2_9HYPO|nr:uncharacterized protein HRG_03348 [Hirsutella rhossiliensis]KAH0965332.1 hypothetical protein HRG_03348 [Hirsutella rhossiliensis]
MASKEANSDKLTGWSARGGEGQSGPKYIREYNVDDSSCDPVFEGHIELEELTYVNEALKSCHMPADSGIDHVGCNETAAASTTCTCGSLFAVTDRKIRDLCYNEHCEIRNQLADISSRLGALEAQLANTKPVCQECHSTKDRKRHAKQDPQQQRDQPPHGPAEQALDDEPRARRRSGGRHRKTCPEGASGAAKTVNKVKLSRVWLGNNQGSARHEYTLKGPREHGGGAGGLWRSETIGADTTLEGVHFALMTDVLFLEVEINGGSHFPITLQWNDETEAFEGRIC